MHGAPLLCPKRGSKTLTFHCVCAILHNESLTNSLRMKKDGEENFPGKLMVISKEKKKNILS